LRTQSARQPARDPSSLSPHFCWQEVLELRHPAVQLCARAPSKGTSKSKSASSLMPQCYRK